MLSTWLLQRSAHALKCQKTASHTFSALCFCTVRGSEHVRLVTGLMCANSSHVRKDHAAPTSYIENLRAHQDPRHSYASGVETLLTLATRTQLACGTDVHIRFEPCNKPDCVLANHKQPSGSLIHAGITIAICNPQSLMTPDGPTRTSGQR